MRIIVYLILFLMSGIARAQNLSISSVEQIGGNVRFIVETDIETPFEVFAGVELADQADDDIYIGITDRVTIQHSPQTIVTSTTSDSSALPSGRYEAVVDFYPHWGAETSPASTKKIVDAIHAKSRFDLVGVNDPNKTVMGELSSVQRTAIKQSVDLYSSLEQCMSAGDFSAYGFSAKGPCRGWMQEFERVRDKQNGMAILNAGHECIASEVYSYGSTFYGEKRDLEWRQLLRNGLERCRDALN